MLIPSAPSADAADPVAPWQSGQRIAISADVNPWGSVRKTYHAIDQEQFDRGVGFTFATTHDNYGVMAKRDGHFSKPLYELDAGDHYFFVVGRSGGYRLDKIHFFKEGVEGFQVDTLPTTPVLPR